MEDKGVNEVWRDSLYIINETITWRDLTFANTYLSYIWVPKYTDISLKSILQYSTWSSKEIICISNQDSFGHDLGFG